MPTMDQSINEQYRVRMMVYGYAKTGKTTWAMRAAEAGYNVILCDMDDGFQVAQRLSPEAQKRIYHVDMRYPFGNINNCGALALCQAVAGRPCIFSETARRYVPAKGPFEDGKEYCIFDLGSAGLETVLIIDSWTAFVEQIYHAKLGIADPTEFTKKERDDFYMAQDVANVFLANLKALRCHVVVIAHAEEYAKRKADASANAQGKDAIDDIYLQPVSTSRAHGRTLAGKFSDVLFFSRPYNKTQIDAGGNDTQDGGSRLLPPGKHDPETFSLADYLELAGTTSPNVDHYESQGVVPMTPERREQIEGAVAAAKKSGPKAGGFGAFGRKA